MLVTMGQEEFDSLDYITLGWKCIEPTIMQIRGKNDTIKSEVYAQLTEGQRALLMFRVLHDHAYNSTAEYYCWISQLLTEPNTWKEVKAGFRYFGDDAMLQILEETEAFLSGRNQSDLQVSPQDLVDDPQLNETISMLYALFSGSAPASLKRVGAYIRSNPEQYVQFQA
ncbi:hypothetical protein [Paenibacillus eucommiae]|uniref:Uncharacterized protein n=1 Tax=Paenibacillus eucommiae TaxID=1355755 RepID=A0ABS4J022_9BACL|nr:hypothetical protein [Paenibacillus eucommiae]MBP1992665.1 hypothetical protein [Paenibacillus eucommiae]